MMEQATPAQIIYQCPRESDVLDALASARWPHRVDDELATHVAECAVCRDVIAVASAIHGDSDAAFHEANVPSSGQMWWRLEMRTRQDAIREASRPVTIAQGVAAILALVVAVVAGWLTWPSVHGLFAATSGNTPAASVLMSPMFIPLAIAMAALLVVAPVAIYVVLSEK